MIDARVTTRLMAMPVLWMGSVQMVFGGLSVALFRDDVARGFAWWWRVVLENAKNQFGAGILSGCAVLRGGHLGSDRFARSLANSVYRTRQLCRCGV